MANSCSIAIPIQVNDAFCNLIPASNVEKVEISTENEPREIEHQWARFSWS